jgi:hypothetical protein
MRKIGTDMERDTMEHQLFTWDGWDVMQTGDFQFYDVTLLVQIGEHPVGTKFPAAFLIGTQSMVVLMNDKDEEFAYPIQLSVGERLPPPDPHEHVSSCDCVHVIP